MLKEARKLYKKMKMKMRMKMKMKTNQLPLTLIELKILPRLPAKSIGRFMCVCKQWKSFLSTPAFARMHLQHVTICDCKLLMFDGREPIRFHTINWEPLNGGSITIPYYRSFDFDPTDDFIILASLDGLVCLASAYVPGNLVFWNPLTGAYKRLPANPNIPFPVDNALVTIGFYTDSSNDYKLLYLVTRYNMAYIYSNSLDSWREIGFLVISNIDCTWSHATFWDQCLYFTVTFDEGHDSIIRFDVETEKYREVQCPITCGTKENCRSLVVLNGCLHLCVSYSILNMMQGDVWRMDGDGEWIKVVACSREGYGRRCVSTVSIGNWIAVTDGDSSFEIMNTEEFVTHYWNLYTLNLVQIMVEIIYVETLVSPM